MEEFKLLLDQYIKKTSVDALAEACGISQRTLYRYVKGERLPDSIERVRKMADFFRLTPEERKRFTASFKAAYYGEDEYHNLTLVDRLLRNLNGLKEMPESDLSFSDKALSLPADTIPLNDDETLMQTAKAILFKEASNEKGKIRLHLDAESSFITEVLKPASTKGIRIEHVNPLHTASGSRNILEFLNDILPVVVNSENYSIYTYYEKEVSLSDERLSSLIITSEYAILANRYLTSGILFSSKDMIEYCKDLFRTFKAAGTEFFDTISSDTLNESFFAQMASTAANPTRDFHNGICMTPYLTEEMIRKYIRLDRVKDVIPLLASHVSNMRKFYSGQSSSGTEISSLEGVRLFMETGQTCEYPIKLYSPLDVTDRLSILKGWTNTLRMSTQFSIRFLKDDWQNRGAHVTCCFLKDSIIFLIGTLSGKVIVFSLYDPVIVSSFNRYFDTQIDDITYPADRSLKMLEDLLKEYE